MRTLRGMVDATEIGEYTYADAGMHGEVEPLPWDSKVTLAKCPRCRAPLLAQQINQFDRDEVGEKWTPPERIFPAKDRELGASVPKAIGEAFTEARTCLRAKAFTAAAIMCRISRGSFFRTGSGPTCSNVRLADAYLCHST